MRYLLIFIFLTFCLIHMRDTKKKNENQRHKEGKGLNHKSMKNIVESYKPKGNSKQTCLDSDCIDTAVLYLKLLKDKISNFEKQFSRVKTQNKTGKSKAGKKGIFGSVIRRLVKAGGGNASNLSCNGNTNSSGAETLQNLTNSLLGCEENIKNACDTSNLPQPDVKKVTDCIGKMKTFKSGVLACMKKTGSEACSCWTDSSLGEDVNAIKKCDLSKESKGMAKAVSKCRNAFGACRKLEDGIGLSIHACTQDQTSLVRKLKNLKTNSAALSSLKTKLSSVTNANGTRSLVNATITCSSFKEKITTILNLIIQNPSSGKISKYILTITAVSVTCTTSEKASFSTITSTLTEAETAISDDETSVQSTLTTLTGTTASSSNIESAKSCEDNCETSVSNTDSDSESSTNSPSGSSNSSSSSSESNTIASIRYTTPNTTTTFYQQTNKPITTISSGQKPINMLSSGQKPINMVSSGQKPINMVSSGQKPIDIVTSGENPIHMVSSGQNPISNVSPGQNPIDVVSSGQEPINTVSSGQKPFQVTPGEQTPESNIIGPPSQGQPPVNLPNSANPVNLSTEQTPVVTLPDDNTPLDVVSGQQTPVSPEGNLLTTRSSNRMGREAVDQLIEQQIKKAKMSFSK